MEEKAKAEREKEIKESGEDGGKRVRIMEKDGRVFSVKVRI